MSESLGNISDDARRYPGSRLGYPSIVTAKGVAKSGRVLYAFSHFYLPFYGYKSHDIFWNFDPFAWISAFVYDVDETMEATGDVGAGIDRLDELRYYLAARIRVDAEVNWLFDDARTYYRFEHDVLRAGAIYTMDTLLAVAWVRSFDLRLMHRVLSQRCMRDYRENLFTWFRSFEMLMEMDDDVSSVDVDAKHGTFNLLVLADRLSGEGGVRFIDGLRRELEVELHRRSREFPRAVRVIMTRVLNAYRSVVAEPVVASTR